MSSLTNVLVWQVRHTIYTPLMIVIVLQYFIEIELSVSFLHQCQTAIPCIGYRVLFKFSYQYETWLCTEDFELIFMLKILKRSLIVYNFLILISFWYVQCLLLLWSVIACVSVYYDGINYWLQKSSSNCLFNYYVSLCISVNFIITHKHPVFLIRKSCQSTAWG